MPTAPVPGFPRIADAMQPEVYRGPDGSVVATGNKMFVGATIRAYNGNATDSWLPGSVIITGIQYNFGSAGTRPFGGNVYPWMIAGDLASTPLSYQTQPVLGIALNHTPPGSWGEIAVEGIVAVRCRDASSDTSLKTVGTYVGVSGDLGEDSGTPGVVESITASTVASATASTSKPGYTLGRIIIPAGTTDTPSDSTTRQTGSNFWCVIRLMLR